MAAFIGRQAQCNAFHFDFVGYSLHVQNDSFLTLALKRTQDSDGYLLGVRQDYTTKSQSEFGHRAAVGAALGSRKEVAG